MEDAFHKIRRNSTRNKYIFMSSSMQMLVLLKSKKSSSFYFYSEMYVLCSFSGIFAVTRIFRPAWKLYKYCLEICLGLCDIIIRPCGRFIFNHLQMVRSKFSFVSKVILLVGKNYLIFDSTILDHKMECLYVLGDYRIEFKVLKL